MNVLLAENDKQAAEGLRLALRICGCRVMYASAADDCFAVARRNDVELLLVDLALPGSPEMDCEDLIRRLKAMNAEMKIVTMAGENSRELEHRIRKLGILCYLTKPVLPSMVRDLVLHLRKRKGITDADMARQPRM